MSIYEMTVGFGCVGSMQMESIKLNLLVKLIYEKQEILQKSGMTIYDTNNGMVFLFIKSLLIL